MVPSAISEDAAHGRAAMREDKVMGRYRSRRVMLELIGREEFDVVLPKALGEYVKE